MLVSATPAVAQTAARPGPWVLDLRAVTSPVPNDTAFYPPLDPSAFAPARGYGLDVGAHVYLFDFGPSRIGAGVSVMDVRSGAEASAAPDADTAVQRLTLTMRTIAPQLSINFGSRDGWSYLSAGAGLGSIDTRTENVFPGTRESGWLTAINIGGGARWFFKERLAFSFDLRFHRIGSGTEAGVTTPATSSFAIGAGISVR